MDVRHRIGLQVLAAHLIGLAVTGIDGTIGTTRGIGLYGAGLGLLVGGLLSIPHVLAVAALIWRAADRINRHPLLFAGLGPVFVVASWWALFGDGFTRFVAVSCVTSAILYPLIHRAGTRLARAS